MYDAVLNAKESVYLEMYIFQNDMEKFNFYNLLRDKSAQGVKVKLILDSLGSMALTNDEISGLRQVGIEILFHSHFFHRGHRKVLITDELIAFVGGVNVHEIARLWRDLVVMIKGGLVQNILRSFIKSYIHCGGKDPTLLLKEGNSPLKQVSAWIVDHSPIKKIFNLKRLYKKHLNEAQERIILVTPYLAPKFWLAETLHHAILRGIKVEVFMPKDTDQFISDRVNYFYMYKLSKLGFIFYLQPKMNHAKAMIVDADQAMVGSQNLDFLSFDFNSETGIFFRDKEVVSKLIEITNTWKVNATVFDYATYKPKWFDYLLSPVIRVFSWFV